MSVVSWKFEMQSMNILKLKRAWKCTTYVMTHEPVTSWWMYVNDFDLKVYV